MSDSLLSDLNPLRIVSRIADGISDTVTDMRDAIAGDHLVIGLTGLSGNGKTTFLTSLAHFLTNVTAAPASAGTAPWLWLCIAACGGFGICLCKNVTK